MTPAVEVEDVFRVYATDEGTAAALQGLSLTVHEGEVVAVLGPSGSGKTTLLRILAGLDRPSAGRVRVAGVDLRRLRGRGARSLPQPPARLRGPALRAGARTRADGRRARLAPAGPRRRVVARAAHANCRAARPGRARGPGRRVSRRAFGRRAAAGRALRGARAPPAAPARRRADRRARREERRGRLRADRRARPARRARPRSSSATTQAPRRSPTASSTSATAG